MWRSTGRARLAGDDGGVAAVVGLVLLLAVVTTFYAHEARNTLPRQGLEAETAWSSALGDAHAALSAGATGAAGERSVSVVLPGPPPVRGVDIPLVARMTPLPPSGSVAFHPECAAFTASHETLERLVVHDLAEGARGCLETRVSAAYGTSFAHRYELGGVLRLQGDRAVVVAGPALHVEDTGAVHRIMLALPDLRGPAATTSLDKTGVRVDLFPEAAGRGTPAGPNAVRVDWTLETQHPHAWKAWFESRLATALPAAPGEERYEVRCEDDCALGPGGRGRVVVELSGPSDDAEHDVELSIEYRSFRVRLG